MTYLPDQWGKGSIFAYSGIDGENTWTDSVAGTLCGDRIGIQFHLNARRELFFPLTDVGNFEHEIVASDILITKLDGRLSKGSLTVLFCAQDTVTGFAPDGAAVEVYCEAPYESTIKTLHDSAAGSASEGTLLVHRTDRGGVAEYSALITKPVTGGQQFALSFSRISAEAAQESARFAAGLDIEKEAERKLDFFRRLPKPSNATILEEKTLNRCFSIMKAQVYSPEGFFKTRWTTPDRIPHKNLWLWDSVFHSFGNRYISQELAYESLMAVLATQREDGFIPLMANPPEERTTMTQPPVLAWGFCRFFSAPGGRDITADGNGAAIFEALARYLKWNMDNRDSNRNLLFEWLVVSDSVTNRCGESGMDNSSRFDNVTTMECIDFSCYMANEARSMAKLAVLLGRGEDADYWNDIYETIKKAVNEQLWDEEDGCYYDLVLRSGKLKKIKAISSFLPLFAGICEGERAKRLVTHLLDPDSFNTPLPMPSIAVSEPSHEVDMWRGPVWMNSSYMIIQGLKECGFEGLARAFTERTLETISFWYMHDGCIYEYFDPGNRISPARLNRKGRCLIPHDIRTRIQNVRDFGWTASLFSALLLEK